MTDHYVVTVIMVLWCFLIQYRIPHESDETLDHDPGSSNFQHLLSVSWSDIEGVMLKTGLLPLLYEGVLCCKSEDRIDAVQGNNGAKKLEDSLPRKVANNFYDLVTSNGNTALTNKNVPDPHRSDETISSLAEQKL